MADPAYNLRLLEHCSVNSVMARTGSFPLRVASRLLRKYGKTTAVVLDPFCGKGTTLLSARLLGFQAYGMDIAPEAIACSRAKLVNVSMSDVCKYIEMLPNTPSSLKDVPTDVRAFFSSSTISQIITIRDRLIVDRKSPVASVRARADFVLGVLLGILHGHASYSLSVPCAHAFSMSPRYVKRFAT